MAGEEQVKPLLAQASGGGKNAQRTQTLAAVQDLKAADFPLTLTTGHWTLVTVNGVDVFHPNTGEVRSDGPEGIACWFVDTNYNQESFFVRQAYFLGAGDTLQVAEDDAQGRNRRGRLGNSEQRHLPARSPARSRGA